MVLQDTLRLWSNLHQLESIQERLNQMYVRLFSKSMFSIVFILFLHTCLFVVIDLKGLG